MTQDELDRWLRTAHAAVVTHLGLKRDWWPTSQTGASAWAVAFFVKAARDRCRGKKLWAHCDVGKKNQKNQEIIDKLWRTRPGREHGPEEVLVDFSVHNWDADNPIQLTGESEMYPSNGVGHSLERPDDYSWDFYKLLLMPSSTRLFIARVAGDKGQSAEPRSSALGNSLASLVDWYGSALLRPHDELGAMILPASKAINDKTLLLWLDQGRLRRAPVSRALV
jgi:hypothetical protein